MSNRPSAKESRNGLAALAASSKRSPLFHWMVEQHDELIRLSAAGGFTWRTLCAVAVELGLSDKKGLAPSSETARKTWFRARAYVRQRQQPASQPVQPEQVEIMPPMRSSVPVGYGSSVPAHSSGSSVPSWMPPDIDAPQASDIVPSDRPRTGLNRLGETPEEAAIRTARRISIARHTVADAGGRIPPRKV